MSWSLTFWGTRGSIPSPGSGTVRYGGNTPCVVVGSAAGSQLILDAGTGIRPLGQQLVEQGHGDLTILLSHTHWDHIQGLPFFGPLYRPGAAVTIRGPRQPNGSLESILRQQMLPAVFPVPVDALAAELAIADLTDAPFRVGNLTVETVALCHPSPTVGFAIDSPASPGRISYLTDNELGHDTSRRSRAALVRFLHNTDTLVHDAMYFQSERAARAGWGHSSAAEAVELALECQARRLVLFHHDPTHDDGALDRLLLEAEEVRVARGGRLEITVAAEGLILSPHGG